MDTAVTWHKFWQRNNEGDLRKTFHITCFLL